MAIDVGTVGHELRNDTFVVYFDTCIHTRTHTCMYAYIHTNIHACMHACIHTYTLIRTHMHNTPADAHVHTFTKEPWRLRSVKLFDYRSGLDTQLSCCLSLSLSLLAGPLTLVPVAEMQDVMVCAPDLTTAGEDEVRSSARCGESAVLHDVGCLQCSPLFVEVVLARSIGRQRQLIESIAAEIDERGPRKKYSMV